MRLKKHNQSTVLLCRIGVKIGMLILAVGLAYALTLGAGCLQKHEFPFLSHLVSAIAVLGLGWILVVLSHSVAKYNWVLVVLFLGIFVVGIDVYSDLSTIKDDKWANVFWTVDSTLSIFFPSRGDYGDVKSFSYPLLHFVSYLYIAMLGISFFGRKVMSRSMRRFTLRRHRNIFWGYSDGGVLLATDIMRKTLWDKAIFVLSSDMSQSGEVEKYRFSEIDSIGGAVMYRDFSRKKKMPRGARHFMFTEDQDLNVRLAFTLLESIKKRKQPRHKIEIFVRTEMAYIENYFAKALEEEELKGKVEINVINESELTARRFIEKYQTLEMPGLGFDHDNAVLNGGFNILQLGYGWTGRAILSKIICNTQFCGSTFSATVFDRDLKSLHGFYPLLDKECFSNEKGAPNCYNVTTEDKYEIGSLDFKEWVLDNIDKYNRIIVALGDDPFNVKIALAIAKVLNDRGVSYEDTSKLIFAHIRNSERYTYFELKTTPISTFGNKDEIYTMGIIINDELDEMASALNFRYANDAINSKDALWRKASISDQESSRAAATAIDNTLRICGMTKVLKKGMIDNSLFAPTGEKLERLAENEHRRWNAFHFTKGIKNWPLSEVKANVFGDKEPSAKQIVERNRHAALLNFDDLDKVDEVFEPLIAEYNAKRGKVKEYVTMKQKDRNFVMEIPKILASMQYQIVKTED